MSRTWRLTLGSFVLVTLSACSESETRTPIAPSSSTPPAGGLTRPPAAGIGSGTVAIRELAPGTGANLGVRSDCRNVSVTVLCADGWRGTFDVLVDRDMTNAVLTARFYNGKTFCAYAASTADVVPAGSQVSFTMNGLRLSDHLGKVLDCRLPATTNRMEVELWSDYSSWSNTLIREFANTYTFSETTGNRPNVLLSR